MHQMFLKYAKICGFFMPYTKYGARVSVRADMGSTQEDLG